MRGWHEARRRQRLVATGLLGVALILGALAQPSTHDISVVDDDHEPGSITVIAGARVTWQDAGGKPRNITVPRGEFGRGRLRAGESVSHTFETPGAYQHQCTIHWSMAGPVVVTDSVPTLTATVPSPSATGPPIARPDAE